MIYVVILLTSINREGDGWGIQGDSQKHIPTILLICQCLGNQLSQCHVVESQANANKRSYVVLDNDTFSIGPGYIT